MVGKLRQFFIKKEWALLVLLAIIFVGVRLPGTDSPLHQDEYKWPRIVNPALVSETEIPHPPLSQFIYKAGGQIVGYNVNFRFIPLTFGLLNLLLLYYLMKIVATRREAIIASIIWTFSFFSVLASLMVDTDGQIMPFFFLIALISYFKLRNSQGNKSYLWGGLLILSCVLGFFIKVSFLLAIGAIVADFIWSKKEYISKRELARYIKWIVVGTLILAGLLFVSQEVFSFFDLGTALTYWKHFIVLDRGWFQTGIQVVKAVLYASPLLIIVPFFANKGGFARMKVFIFFLIFAFLFYVVLFDFSIGALDRYLQLLVLPLTVFSSIAISNIYSREENRRVKSMIIAGTIVGILILLVQFLQHYVPPLHPKSEWISRFLSLRWNFLYPFSGGSGPLGFYVSFLFMVLTWALSVFVLFVSKWKPHYKKVLLSFLIPITIMYNGVFISEYLFGTFHGSAPKLLEGAVEFIEQNDDIEMVTVYNDNGGDEIRNIGKYRKRLYIDPSFDLTEKVMNLNQYKEHYLVLDIPRIDPNTVYRRYLDSCEVIYSESDKQISAVIYDCINAPDVFSEK